MRKNVLFHCEYCQANFKRKDTLLRHLKTSKKCLEKRSKIEIKCIWCNEIFLTRDKLEKHNSKCGVNKEIAYISLLEKVSSLEQQLEEKNKMIENKDIHIKELEEKLFKLANKATTTNNTYNINLNCDKPLLLSKERVTDLMWKYLTVEDMKLGGGGYCRWFLKHVAINEKGNITIECTDKNRKVFKYIDEGDKLITKEGKDIAELIRSCYSSSGFLNQSEQGLEYQKYIEDYNDTDNFINFTIFKKNFINSLAEKTYKESLISKLN